MNHDDVGPSISSMGLKEDIDNYLQQRRDRIKQESGRETQEPRVLFIDTDETIRRGRET